MIAGTDLGGVQGVATPPPPNGQSHSIKCSTTNGLRYALALINPRRMREGYGSRSVCLSVCLLPR